MIEKIKSVVSAAFTKKKVLTNVIGFLVILLPTLIYASTQGLLVDLPVLLIMFFGGISFEKIKIFVYSKLEA